MGRAVDQNLMQHSFTTGEVSPSIVSRQDIQMYASALKRCENFQIAPQGGIYRDTGTVHVNEAKLSTNPVRVLSFKFSITQAYILEFGNFYVRFYASGGRIEDGGSPIEIVSPYAATDLFGIQFTQSADFLYLTHPSYPPYALARLSQISWTLTPTVFKDGPYLESNTSDTNTLTASGVTGSVTITAVSATFDAGNVGGIIRLEEAITSKYNQWAANIAYGNGAIVQNAGRVYMVTNGSSVRTDGPQHVLGQWQNGVSYPTDYWVYWGENVYFSAGANTSGQTPPVHTSGTVSDGGVSWLYIGKKSGPRAPVNSSGTETDGNLTWQYLHSGFGIAKITAYTSPTVVTATVLSRLPDSTVGGTLRWRLGAWDAFNGYPSCCTFYLGRLWFAGTNKRPQSIWGSNSGDYYNFAPTDVGGTVLDTNSISVTLASAELDRIIWLLAETKLLIGTSGSEWILTSGSNSNKGLSPSNVEAKPQSTLGSLRVPAKLVNTTTIYVHRSGNRIYEYSYDYARDRYISKELTLLADHVLRDGGGCADIAYQKEPFSTIWLVRNDGQLVGCTYLSEEKVTGFHRHIYDGKVESVAVIPNTSGTGTDQVWMVINRTISGQTKRHIEYMQEPFFPSSPQDKDGMWYVEAGLSLTSGTDVSTISGLDYLEGKSVVPIVDGGVQPERTVSGGSITLQKPGKHVVVGLPYTSVATIMPIDFNGPTGTIQGQIKNVNRIILRLLNSLGFKYGNGEVAGFVRDFRTNNALLDQSPGLFTGDFPALMEQQNTTDGILTLVQDQPYPLNVLAIITEVKGYES